MPRKVPQHAGLEVLQERTRAALAALASGFRTESDCEPKVLYDALVGVIVRIVFLFLAGELASVESTWEELVAAFRRLDGEMAERDRLLHAFPFVAEATVEDGVAGEVLRALFYVDRASADVEHLGTVYESMMGYGIEVAREPSLGVVCRRKAGDSQVGALVGLASLLALAGPERRAALEGMDIEITERIGAAVERSASIEQLARALRTRTAPQTPSILPAGARALTSTPDRRRSGSHYTPRALGDRVVEDALGPLLDALGANPSPEEVLRLKVCDPAMGSGAFLLAACRFLGERLVRSWQHRGESADASHARYLVAKSCIYGVDKDASAVLVTKLSLELLARDGVSRDAMASVGASLDATLRQGDSLVSFDYKLEFPEVFASPREGFDAFVGNPPWVSYAGRAAQPLEPRLYESYAAKYASFAGYRNLQGLFIERAATLLRPSGRLGFIVPSSMAELEGYGPTRRAHDRWCVCDPNLRDFGNEAFFGVFQPCMGLVSTRRASDDAGPSTAWPIERTHLDATGHGLLAKMAARPPLPPHLFGERGIQTAGGDVEGMRDAPDAERTLALRNGGDIEPFLRRAPSLYCDPERLSCRVRDPNEWEAIRVLIRQTARVPMAALSDGLAFRNSILAGFADLEYPATFLVAYLNATPLRWLHYVRHRDARQGMPQLKIGHLRATPAPPHRELVAELSAFGERLGAANAGIDEADQRHLDEAVARAFELTDDERALIAEWWKKLA